MYYIPLKSSDGLETVDEFYSRKEAIDMLKEYRMGDPANYYYISSRCCKAWRS